MVEGADVAEAWDAGLWWICAGGILDMGWICACLHAIGWCGGLGWLLRRVERDLLRLLSTVTVW
jgi:hypothetical protein